VCGRCRSSIPVTGSFPDRPITVSDWNFREEVLDFPGSVTVEFFSPSCGYSRRLAPVLEELAREYSDRIKFVKLDITMNRLVPAQYEVSGTPTLIFMKAGKIVNRVTGLLPKSDIAGYLNYLAGA